MFRALGHFTYRRRWWVLAAGAIFLACSAVFGLQLLSHLTGGGYMSPRSESAAVARTLTEDFGAGEAALVVLFWSKDGTLIESPEFEKAAREVLDRLKGQPGIRGVQHYYDTQARQLVSPDHLSTFAVLQLDSNATQPERVWALRALLRSDKLVVQLGGAPAVNADVIEQVNHDLAFAEMISAPIVAVLLVIVFGTLVAAALPLTIGALAILGAFLILRILTLFTPVSVFAMNVVSMLGAGLAIDYSLFIVSRFREELAAGKTVEDSLGKTLETAGVTVLFSGMTVTISLMTLLLFPQMFMRSIGIGGSAGVVVAMVGSLTILPALLAVLGPKVNALSVAKLLRRPNRKVIPKRDEQGFWFRLSHLAMRHPVKVLVLTLIPLLVGGLPFLHVHFSMPDERNIPHGMESRQVAERMRAQFAANEISPINVLVRMPGPPLDPVQLGTLYEYTNQLRAIPGVKRVDGLLSLDARLDQKGLAGYLEFYQLVEAGMAPEGQVAVNRFAHGNNALLEVYYTGAPYGLPNRALVKALRGVPAPLGSQAQVGGQTAELVDLLHDLGHTVPICFGAIVGIIFILLFLMLGSLVVPLKAVLLNILSLSVSFGALVWMFQDGHGGKWFGYEALGGIDALQPVLIFVIAFGLSMDYEVFLLSRIKEAFDQTKDNTASVALGVQRTGQIITSAAALLGVVIIGFASGKVLSVKQVGVGLLLAVLVDATLVRSLLVPATMRLLGDSNWWAPKPLRLLYEKIGLGELERPSEVADEAASERPPSERPA